MSSDHVLRWVFLPVLPYWKSGWKACHCSRRSDFNPQPVVSQRSLDAMNRTKGGYCSHIQTVSPQRHSWCYTLLFTRKVTSSCVKKKKGEIDKFKAPLLSLLLAPSQSPQKSGCVCWIVLESHRLSDAAHQIPTSEGFSDAVIRSDKHLLTHTTKWANNVLKCT